jgi:hypothetical protein
MQTKLELPSNRVFSISVGAKDRNTKAWEDEAEGFNELMMRRTFIGADTQVLLGKNATPNNVQDAISTFTAQAEVLDTLFFFYSGHGLPETLTLSRGKRSIDYPKQELFDTLSTFPGRKITILSCCHGGYPTIPDNTLLVAPSRQETPAYGNAFLRHLHSEFAAARTAPQALAFLIERFLTSYHNRPYGPLVGNMWEQDPDRPDLQIYEEEKQLGKELLINYQRAFVLSTLAGNGTILTVDPRCFFKPKS